jgi:hypothetical protein
VVGKELDPVGVGAEEGVDVACGRALASARLVKEMSERENFILGRFCWNVSYFREFADPGFAPLYLVLPCPGH